MKQQAVNRSIAPSPDPIVEWRRDRLLAAGFGFKLASDLAGDRRIDLHAVLGLIDRGCAPPLAARILAPLEERP